MTNSLSLLEGQILTGPLFSEPMRVETAREGADGSWTAGLVSTQTEPGPEPDTTIEPGPGPVTTPGPKPEDQPGPEPGPDPEPLCQTIRVHGAVPPELWNRLGTKLLPKLRAGKDLKVGIDISTNLDASTAKSLMGDLRQILQDLDLTDQIHLDDL